jgi:hypothetical protein
LTVDNCREAAVVFSPSIPFFLMDSNERCPLDSYSRRRKMPRPTSLLAIVRHIVTAVFVFALGASSAAAQPGPPRIDVPPVPMNLEVEAGHEAFLAGYAVGTQNYVCLPAGNTVAWRFLGPQATLFRTTSGDPRQQLTTHFLSVNPEEMFARPTWQHSIDSSRVWGRVKASSKDANFVAPGAIDWLLLEAAGEAAGPIGGGVLTQTTFIHRVNTSGGTAPATGCSDANHVGTLVLVPYSTDYFFYRAAPAR